MSDGINDAEPVSTPEPKVKVPTEKKVKVTDAEKDAFFKAFLADKPYQEKMPLFDGKLVAHFKTLDLNENDVVFQQIDFDQAKGIAKSDDSYLIKIVQYRLAGCLLALNDNPFCEDITMESHPADKDKGITYLKERLTVMQKWPVFKLGAITEAFNAFESKVQQLTKDAFTETF